MARVPAASLWVRWRAPAVLLLLTALHCFHWQRAAAAPGAPPRTNVVLFAPAGADPLAARLEAELLAVGIQVQKVATPAERELEVAVARAIASGASAAIRVLPRARGADVWTGETTARMSWRRSPDAAPTDLSVIALRTVEYLRATLLEVKQRPASAAVQSPAAAVVKAPDEAAAVRDIAAPVGAPRASVERTGANERAAPAAGGGGAPTAEAAAPAIAATAGEQRPNADAGRGIEPAARAEISGGATPPAAGANAETGPPPVTAARKSERLPEWGLEAPPELAAPREPLHLEVAAGPAFLVSPGGVGAITALAAFGRARMSSGAGLELMAVVPLAPALLRNTEGTVEVKATLLGAALVFQAEAPRRLKADAAVGAAAVMMRAAGTGAAPAPDGSQNLGSVQAAWRMAAHLRLGGGVDLLRWLCLRADVVGGLTARTAIGYDVTTVQGQTVMRDRATWGPAFATATLGLQASW